MNQCLYILSLYFILHIYFRLTYHKSNEHIHNINTNNENVNVINNENENEYTQDVNTNYENITAIAENNEGQSSTNVLLTEAIENITPNLSQVDIMTCILLIQLFLSM